MVGIQRQEIQAAANDAASEAGSEAVPFSLQGVHAEELSAVLSLVPKAEKFAKFWICRAKLLARSGPFDVLQLYREAVSAGAEVSGACQLPVFTASALDGFLEIQGPGF